MRPIGLLCVSLALPVPVEAASLRQLDETLDLGGAWLFLEGDNAAFAAEQFDDSEWQLRRFPTGSSAFSRRRTGHGWYRLHFDVAKAATGSALELVIGSTHGAIEVYVNGEPIARRGEFAARPVIDTDVLPLAGILRPGLLHAGDNVVAVRVFDPTYNGGVPIGPILIGPAELTLPPSALRGRIAMAVRVGLALLALCLGFAQLLTVFGRRATREHWWLVGAGIAVAVLQLGGTGVLPWLARDAQLAYRLPIVGGCLGVLCLGSFFASRYDDWGAGHVRIARYAMLAVTAILFVVWESVVYLVGEPILLLVGLVTTLYAANLLSKAARRQEAGAVPVFLGLVLFGLSFLYDGMMASGPGVFPPLSAMGAVGVLLVTSVTTARTAISEHERVLAEMLRLRSEREGELPRSILDATAMSITHPDEFLEAAVREAARQLEVRRCSLVLAGEDGRLVVRAAVGLPSDASGQEVDLEGTIAGWVFANGEAVGSATLPEELAAMRRGRGYKSEGFVSHPVQHGLRILGVLNASDRNDGGDFAPSHEIEVGEVADKLALVLTRLGRTAGTWEAAPRSVSADGDNAPVIKAPDNKARRITDRVPPERQPDAPAALEPDEADAHRLASPGPPQAGATSSLRATQPSGWGELEAEVESAVDSAVVGLDEPPDLVEDRPVVAGGGAIERRPGEPGRDDDDGDEP
jgi:hypothetical protein